MKYPYSNEIEQRVHAITPRFIILLKILLPAALCITLLVGIIRLIPSLLGGGNHAN